MIPKIIHYCWFGKKPLSELALKCIASWKKYLPDYEIKEWNESNFNVNQISYTVQAYKCKKYAFVSDYARFKIMYEYGGIYFDTDVEVIKPLDDLIARGAFFGMETCDRNLMCAPGLDFACNAGLGFACNAGLGLCKEMIEQYEHEKFILSNGMLNLETVVTRFSNILQKHGFKYNNDITEFEDVFFYPPKFFCPINYHTGEKNITQNTYTIHHFAASWVNKYDNLPLYAKIWKFLHLPDTDFRGKIRKLLNHNT